MKTRALMLVAGFHVLVGAADAPKVQPGKLWRISTIRSVDTVNGEPGDPRDRTHETKEICSHDSTSSKIEATIQEAFLNGMQLFDFKASGGVMSFHGIRPVDANGNTYDFEATGTYSDSRITLEVKAQGIEDGDRVTITGHFDGHPVGACP